jgi:Brp/Blh family beta-carotene 15,15'-monooxygenase
MQKIQGLSFCIIAWVFAIYTLCYSPTKNPPDLILIFILIFFFGVPHGALDIFYAYKKFGTRSMKSWVQFFSFYFLSIGFVLILWILCPILFLVSFLMISIFHFSGDLSSGAPLITRTLYGAAIIVLPTFYYQDEVTRLFSYLINAHAASFITLVLHKISWLWLIGLLAASILRLKQDRLSGLEVLSATILALLVPPLLAFTVFFCLMHSVRHVLRTFAYFGDHTKLAILGATVLPMIATGLLAIIWWQSSRNMALDGRTAQLIFVGLAALTLPHMAVIEPIRLRGWTK